MTNAIVVLNAGSSSIKFSVFLVRREDLNLQLRGQIEGVDTTPHFVAKQTDGSILEEKSWPANTKLGHDGALDYVFEFLKAQLANETLIGVGHRVVHGGLDYQAPVRVYLANHHGMDTHAIQDLIYNRSGLLGVSGISSDMRTLLASIEPRAKLAIDLYCYRICREAGSLAAALGGLDGIIFTGGIGEHSAAIRQRVCSDLEWLGVELDESANNTNTPRISVAGSAISAWTIPTNEELMIARHTRKILEHISKN